MTGLAAEAGIVSIGADEESMARPTIRSQTFAIQRAQRGSKYVAEAFPARGGGFHARFAAPGYELAIVERDGVPEHFEDEDSAQLAAARILLAVLTHRSNQLAMEKNDRYRKMTPAEFANALADAGVTAELFAHIYGTDPNRVRKWIEGLEDVPHPARVVLAMMAADARNVDIAQATTDAVATAKR